MARGEIINHISHEAKRFKSIIKPDKLLLSNPNLFKALCLRSEIGTVRESFFISALSYKHQINNATKADFIVDEKYFFEVGGKNKDFPKERDSKNYFLALDGIEIGFWEKIPLWLFGFLY